jgi:uridine kinase
MSKMNKTRNPCGIIVFGANGSGKTTLARELARILQFKHMDIEDYYFLESEIPYTNSRSRDEAVNLMIDDIDKYGSFVISAVNGDFGEKIAEMYKLAVYITVPLETRLERIKQREYIRFGDRVRKGGDMYEQQLEFHDFVATRSLSGIDRWAETLSCPVIHVDGTTDWRVNAADIADMMDTMERFHK